MSRTFSATDALWMGPESVHADRFSIVATDCDLNGGDATALSSSQTRLLRRPHSADHYHSDISRRGIVADKIGAYSTTATFTATLTVGAVAPSSTISSSATTAAQGTWRAEPLNDNLVDSYRSAPSLDLVALGKQLHQLSHPFDAYFAFQRRQLAAAEQHSRFSLTQDESQNAESLWRTAWVQGEEAVARASMERQRRVESWYPWCTAACRYCCTSRFEWSQHTRRSWEAAQAFLVSLEADTRALRESALLAELDALEMFLAASLSSARLLQAEAATVEAESLHVRSILALHEDRLFSEMLERKQNLLREHYDTARLEHLWQREVLADQRDASASARWSRSLDQSVLQCHEDERHARRALQSEESSCRTYVLAQRTHEHGALQETLWRRDHQHLTDELQALRDFRKQAEAAERQKKLDEEYAVQQELLAEFSEIKRLKKQGPPRGSQPLPPCKRCGSVPEKDEFTHRTLECIERPVNCLRCQQVMRASLLERHKVEDCPQRVVSCPSCLPLGSYYCKAVHYDTVHKLHCAVLPSYREWMACATKRPACLGLPVEVKRNPSRSGDEAAAADAELQLFVDVSTAREWACAGDAGRQSIPSVATTSTSNNLVISALRQMEDKIAAALRDGREALPYTATIVHVFAANESAQPQQQQHTTSAANALLSLESALARFDLGDPWIAAQSPPTARVILRVEFCKPVASTLHLAARQAESGEQCSSPAISSPLFIELDCVPVLPCVSDPPAVNAASRLCPLPSSCYWCQALTARPMQNQGGHPFGRVVPLVGADADCDGAGFSPPKLCCLHAEYVLRCVAVDTANLCKPQVERKGKKR